MTTLTSDEEARLSEVLGGEDLAAAKHPVAETVTEFGGRLRGLFDAYPAMVAAVSEEFAQTRPGYTEMIGSERLADPHSEAPPAVRSDNEMPLSKQTRFIRAQRRWLAARNARRDMPRACLLELMAHYDAFLADLLRALYEIRQDLKHTINREISYQDLLRINELEEARELGIEKDISAMLHQSRPEQLKWMARKATINLDRIASDADFIELCERRNVIAHNGGRATTQYLLATRANHIELGEELGVDADYLEHAYTMLFEVGVQLAHRAWRQVRPDERATADKVLARTGYELLVFEEFELARRILQFAVTLTPHASDYDRRRFVINLAQANKWLDDDSACADVLACESWPNATADFRLAVAVLEDDFARAGQLMREAVESGRMVRVAFHDWPLFRRFREREEFRAAYRDLYGAEFDPAASPR